MKCVVGVNFSTSCKQYNYYYDLPAEVDKGDELQVNSPYSGITTVKVVEIINPRSIAELHMASARLKPILKNLSKGEEFETNNFGREHNFNFKINIARISDKLRECVQMRDLTNVNTGKDIQQAVIDDQKESVKQSLYKFLLQINNNLKGLNKTITDFQNTANKLKDVQINLVKDFDEGTLDVESINTYAKQLNKILS